MPVAQIIQLKRGTSKMLASVARDGYVLPRHRQYSKRRRFVMVDFPRSYEHTSLGVWEC